ncbi:MAG: type II secretion system F family protein [bacterium]
MPTFDYKVRNMRGNTITGVMDAKDRRSVIDKLRVQKLVILSVDEKKASAFAGMFSLMRGGGKRKRKVAIKHIVTFSRQLSTLVNAGVPIVQGLVILNEQIENKAMGQVVSEIRNDVESGLSIAEALGRHPEAFTELYVSMVRSGEAGGVLDVILDRLSGYLETSQKLRGKVKGAMVYPAVISLVAIGVTTFLLTVVIPAFKTAFSSFGAKLPLPTQILISLSEFLRAYFLVGIAGIIVIGILFSRFLRTEIGRKKYDTILLKLPMFGSLIRKVAVAKFTRTLGTLVKSGVPILEALDTTAKTSGNKIIEEAIMRARTSIKEGERISGPLKASNVFPPMVIQMITVGEETGALDTMLNKVADFYDQEVEVAIGGLTSMIEPVIIVIMGVAIGAIVIAMFLPMFELGNVVSQGG